MTGMVITGEALATLLFGGTSSAPDTTAIQSRKTTQMTELFFHDGLCPFGSSEEVTQAARV